MHELGKKTPILDSMKIKNICCPKDTTYKMKGHGRNWDKLLAKHISNKGLVSRVQK